MVQPASKRLVTEASGATQFARKRPGFAPNTPAPLLITTPVAITSTVFVAMGQDPATGMIYGSSQSNGHYVTSTDGTTWTDRTYSPATFTPSVIGFEFDATYMYAYSSLGRVWRAAKNTFNAWTEITPPGMPAGTTGRPGSLCVLPGGVLLYGNYNANPSDGAHIYRSSDSGATWTEVVTIVTARHVHAIRYNAASGNVWASVGDAGYAGNGLYKSSDNGATWTYMSSNEYGIDMVFVPAAGPYPDLVVLEGDGLNRPHLVAFPEAGAAGDKTFPLVWFTGAPADPNSTRATVRGIAKTPQGHIVYWTTTESGAVGTRAGLYVAQAPDYTRGILLADTTGTAESNLLATFFAGSTMLNHVRTTTTPTFGSF